MLRASATNDATRLLELFVKWRATWPLLGAVYVLAGVYHFGMSKAFKSIYPPPGTWGVWYLPVLPLFHVVLTGVAESEGREVLLGGGAGEALGGVDSDGKTTLP